MENKITTGNVTELNCEVFGHFLVASVGTEIMGVSLCLIGVCSTSTIRLRLPHVRLQNYPIFDKCVITRSFKIKPHVEMTVRSENFIFGKIKKKKKNYRCNFSI